MTIAPDANIKIHLREILHRYRVSYEELSKETGISASRIRAIYNGKKEPNKKEIEAIRAVALSKSFTHGSESWE